MNSRCRTQCEVSWFTGAAMRRFISFFEVILCAFSGYFAIKSEIRVLWLRQSIAGHFLGTQTPNGCKILSRIDFLPNSLWSRTFSHKSTSETFRMLFSHCWPLKYQFLQRKSIFFCFHWTSNKILSPFSFPLSFNMFLCFVFSFFLHFLCRIPINPTQLNV